MTVFFYVMTNFFMFLSMAYDYLGNIPQATNSIGWAILAMTFAIFNEKSE